MQRAARERDERRPGGDNVRQECRRQVKDGADVVQVGEADEPAEGRWRHPLGQTGAQHEHPTLQ
jgi:hypothetical protein